MSRIGKKPIPIPAGVEVKIEGEKVIIKGPKGEIHQNIRPEIDVKTEEKNIFVLPKEEFRNSNKKSARQNKKIKAFRGLFRALIANAVKGVTAGYEKKLQIEGVGYRASLKNDDLILQVGFTHPVEIKAPPGIKFSVEKNIITVSGIDKHLVSQTAAVIRKIKPPEPYKGKGIRYLGEVVRRKTGKKAIAAGG